MVVEFDLIEDSTDHQSYEVWKDGKFIFKIKNSNSPKDWQNILMAKDMHISKTQLLQYKDCTFSNDQLKQKIKDKGYWP